MSLTNWQTTHGIVEKWMSRPKYAEYAAYADCADYADYADYADWP